MYQLLDSRHIVVGGKKIETPSNISEVVPLRDCTVIAMLTNLVTRLQGVLGSEGAERNIWAFSNKDGALAWRVEPLAALTGGTKVHAVPTPYTSLKLRDDLLVAGNWAGFECAIDPTSGRIRRLLPDPQTYQITALNEVVICGHQVKFDVNISQLLEFKDTLIVLLSVDELIAKNVNDEELERNVYAFSLESGRLKWRISRMLSDAERAKMKIYPHSQFFSYIRTDGEKLLASHWLSSLCTIDLATGKILAREFEK